MAGGDARQNTNPTMGGALRPSPPSIKAIPTFIWVLPCALVLDHLCIGGRVEAVVPGSRSWLTSCVLARVDTRPCADIRLKLGIMTRKPQVVARELPGREDRVEKGAGCAEVGLLCPASHLGDDLSVTWHIPMAATG